MICYWVFRNVKVFETCYVCEFSAKDRLEIQGLGFEITYLEKWIQRMGGLRQGDWVTEKAKSRWVLKQIHFASQPKFIIVGSTLKLVENMVLVRLKYQ